MDGQPVQKCFVGSGYVGRGSWRSDSKNTMKKDNKLEFIWIHVKLISSISSYGSHKSRLLSGLEKVMVSRWETDAASRQKSRLLKWLLWHVALLLLLQML